MNEENNIQNNNIQNPDTSTTPTTPTSKSDLLTDDFFSQIKTSKKINDKKKKIDELTKSLQEDPSYLNSSENQQKITQLYDLLISNLNENNNNYVSSQMKLIETLINNSKNNENTKFKNFAKQALPKLFDKYYLQNQKINDNLTGLLNKFIENKILNLQDYYPHIENISLEEEDNYRNNIMNLLNEQFTKNNNITLNEVPKGIIDIVNKLSEDEDETVSDIAKKSLEILNNRKQEEKKENTIEEKKDINEEKKENTIEEKNDKNEEKKENIIEEKNDKNEEKKDTNEEKNEITNKGEENVKDKIQENEIKEKEMINDNKDNNNNNINDNNKLINNNNETKNNEETKNENSNINDDKNESKEEEKKEENKESINIEENKQDINKTEEKKEENEIKEEKKDENKQNEDKEKNEKKENENEDKEKENGNEKKQDDNKDKNEDIKDNNLINNNEKENDMLLDEIEENQMTEIPLFKIDDDLLNIEGTNNLNTDNLNKNLNEQNTKNDDNLNLKLPEENEHNNDNDNNDIFDEKEKESENKKDMDDKNNDDNKISQDKEDNNENNKKEEIIESKKEEIVENKNNEEDKKDLLIKNSQDKNSQNENNQNIENQNKDNLKNQEKEKEIIDNQEKKEDISPQQQVVNEKDNINEKNTQNNENVQIVDKKEENITNNDLINNNKNENKKEGEKNDINIEKKESNIEQKDNNNNIKKEEEKKEGGVKRSAIQGKLNKFRKQFGKTKKKNVESTQKEEDANNNNTNNKQIKTDEKTEKEKNMNELYKTENISESKNLLKEISDINENNNNEIQRTNTLEEMFKKKFEDGFDTETTNILDLGKNHNDTDNNNVLNEIQDKLGIDFNEIITKKSDNIDNNDNNKNVNDNNNNNNLDNININIEKKIKDEKETNIKNNAEKDAFNDTHDSKRFINPDDRPIHPSSSLNFNFDLDFDEQEKSYQKKESNKEKPKKTIKKNFFEDQDLEELGKKVFDKSNTSNNGIESNNNSNNNISSSDNNNKNNNINDNNKEVNPFNIDNFNDNKKKIENDKDEIKNLNNALNDLNNTINNLDNLNNFKITKKTSEDERRPKIKVDEFQKKLEMALKQEEAVAEHDPSPLQESDNNKNDNDKEKEKEKFKEDPRFDTIKSILGKEIVDSLFSQRWEDKKHGYELINNFLESNDISSANSNDLYEYIRIKLKNFKETNFNVNREALNVFITMTKKNVINKDNLITIISTYYDKITDTKLKDNYLELLNLSLSLVDPNTVLKQLLLKITKKNNVKLFIEYSLFFGKIIEDYNNKDLPYKEITEFCKIMANNNNPQSRNAGMNLICILYKYYGEEIHKLIKDIKESTLKNIEGELSKVTVIERKSSKKLKSDKKRVSEVINSNIKINGGEKEINGGGNGEMKQNTISDISKKITPQILKDISDGKWAEKKDACEQIEKMLNEANMRISPNGLNDLMNLIKKKLTDGNKNIVRMMVNLLTQLIEALKLGFKQWAKYMALNLIPNLSDKNQLLRNECQICFDKWVEFVGFDTLIIYFPSFLKNDNVEIRTEIMNFITKYKNKFNKEIGIPVFKEMSNNLLLCLQDRSASVRTQAEEIIKLSLNYIKLSGYYNKIKEFKPAITNDLKIILDKIQSEINENNNNNSSTTNPSEANNTNIESNNNNDNSNKNNNDEYDIDIEHESNININELINSNPNNNSNNKNNNGNGATSQRNIHKNNPKKEDINSLKSNSTILGNCDNKLSLHSNNNGNMKFKKNTNKNKIRNSVSNLNKSVNSINSDNKSKEKDSIEKENKSKVVKTLIGYKTCMNFNKKKNIDKNASPPKSASKKEQTSSKIKNKNERHISTLSQSLNQNSTTNLNVETPKSERTTQSKLGFTKIKGISNSLILKKTDKKGKKETASVFLTNYKVVPNKLKRLDKDLKFKFSLDYICRDSSVKSKLKDTCKNLFVEDFGKKIFSDDFKKQVMALKEMKDQLDKKINIPIYFDNLDLILKIIGINLNGNINPTLAKNLFEFLDSLYNIIAEKGLMLSEIETNIILSLLIDKLSINNSTLKEYLLKLLYEYIELNGINKIMALVLNIALGKNSKIKTDILDFTIELYNNKKLNIMSKNYVKILGKFICSNDNIIKAKVLILLKEIFAEIGDELSILLDFLTDKDREFLENNLYVDNDEDFDEEEEVEIDNQHLGGMNSSDEEIDDNNNNNNNNINNNNNANIANGAVNSENELLSTLNNLLLDDIKIRLNTIILLHEIISQKYEENKQILIPNIDNIINTFIKVTHELFISSDINTIPVKFAKYISTVILKITSNKELISNISYKVLYDFTNELLNYLLIKGFEKIGENREGDFIFKSINSSMLRVIDNCDKTSVIIVLLEILKNYQNSEDKKMGALTVKCLLKCTENLSQIINGLNIIKIFNEFHIIIVKYEKMYPELKNNNQTDTVIIRFIKNFIYNTVKIKKDTILDIYNNSVKKSEIKDEYIIHWIQSTLDSINKIDNNLNINETMNNNQKESSDNNNKEKNEDKKKDDVNENEKKSEENDKKEKNDNDNNKNEKGNNTIDQLKKKWNDIKPK